MTTIQSSFRQFSSLYRIILAAALLLSSLTFVPTAQALLFGSHGNPDITAQNLTVSVDNDDEFSILAPPDSTSTAFFTLNSNIPAYNGAWIKGTYSLNFNKNSNFGELIIYGELLDISMLIQIAPLVSLDIELFKYDYNFGAQQFLGVIDPDLGLDPALKAAGFDASQYFGVQFSMDNSQCDVFNTPVPEPSTIILLGAGLLGIVAASRRRRQ